MRPVPSWLAVAALALATGCGCNGDETCGPGDAAESVTASAASTTLTFGALSSLTGNDCPDPDAPEGVISIAVAGTQIDEGQTGRLTLCIPRPDLLEEGGKTFGNALSDADVRIIDVKGTHAGCAYMFDSTRPPSGTASATGLCDAATDPAGFALVLDGQLSLRRDCAGVVDVVDVTMAGTVAVAFRSE